MSTRDCEKPADLFFSIRGKVEAKIADEYSVRAGTTPSLKPDRRQCEPTI
jgi:hypothetical protein